MKIRYFSDTDTALIEFLNVPAVETKEISENLYIDLDDSEVSFLQMEKSGPNRARV